MWIRPNGDLYEGDCRNGDREATAEEVAAWEASKTPTAEQMQKSARLQASIDFMASGGFIDVGLTVKNEYYRVIRENPVVQAMDPAPTDAELHAYLSNPASPYYNANYVRFLAHIENIKNAS